jgi:N-acetylneuraminate synthase
VVSKDKGESRATLGIIMSIFVIAEIGINHNGLVDNAIKMIDVAKEAGCDAVKFQKRTVDLVYSKEILSSARQSPFGTTTRAQKEGLEFGATEYQRINEYCREVNIKWSASAWDRESQRFLRQFDLTFNKIASAMIVDLDHCQIVAEEKKHTFISTGMSTLAEIDKAVEIFKKAGCSYELMHCVSTYPMSDKDANLKCIETLRERYRCNVGYSGHEAGLAISYGAAALGISSLERHITLNRAMYGSDQAASIEPSGLRMLVGAVRKIDAALGDGTKKVLNSEVEVAKKLRAHISNR